jgi:hypothetical protein
MFQVKTLLIVMASRTRQVVASRAVLPHLKLMQKLNNNKELQP